MKKILLILVCVLSGLSFNYGQNQDASSRILSQGKEFFQLGRYVDALTTFRELSLTITPLQGEAAFWTIKSLLALQKLDEAQVALESYIKKFPKDSNQVEALYLRGRILYLSADVQGSISAFAAFLEQYKNTVFSPNAYYWMGEGMLSIGRLDEAEKLFQLIVTQYASSAKSEAAGYKLSLIALKHREEELLSLLTWSHEENIKNIEDFQRREIAYQDALRVYQGKLLRLAPDDFKAELGSLQLKTKEYDAKLKELQARIDSLLLQDKESQTNSALLKEKIASLEKELDLLKKSQSSNEDALSERKKLLDAKEEALKAKEAALLLLEQNSK